ncbi:MAG: choice-of-anchor Q domain-containing protein [Bacteroidota bacterium]|nr:choice-of-anchor Q domain-containing protein [Bacteroidota bacterium]
MKTKFISLKTLICCLLFPMLCIQIIQAAVTDSQVANWKDNKTAAFLLMFDDGLNSAYQVAIPELLKRNMIATLYVNPGGNKWSNPAVEGPNEWENLIPKTGMVYADHTWTHNGAATWEIEDSEVVKCQEKIMSMFYKDGKPHLISYGQPGVTTWFSYGADLTALLAKYNLISRPTFDGHGAVYHWQTVKQMLALADKAIALKGMEYLITHGVERRVSEGDPNWGFQDFWALNKDTLRGVLDGLAVRRDRGDLWITDHISQYKYQMERDNKPTFQVLKSDNNEIQLTMTGTLDQGLYDLPLTVITQVPASWVSAYITQGAKTYSVPVVHGLATYDAYPNGTPITVKINTDPTAPTGTASSVYLVQPGGTSAIWSGTVTGTIVDLSVQGKSLNEWYKATTFNIGDEIWLIKGNYFLTDTIATKTTETIRGGFAGTEHAIGDRAKGTNAWDFTNETIIDGNNLVRGFVVSTGATIDGLTVQNCAYPVTSTCGNAAAVKITSSSIVQNCIVRNNTITGPATAGGIYSGGVSLTTGGKLLNSYIHDNSCANTGGGGNGGGVSIYQSATVDGCTISNNTAYNAGGGVNIIAKLGGAVVNNSIISNNTATNSGGGGVNVSGGSAFTNGLSLTISNCTVSSNTAKTNGGGLYMDVTNGGSWEGNPVNIQKCIVSSNTATGTTGSTGNGGGIYFFRGILNVNGCTINNNISKAPTTIDNNGGGGIFLPYSNGSTLNLTNSVLKGNVIGTGKNAGSAINTDVASTLVRNCLITGNTGVNFHTQGAGRVCTYQNCTIAGNATLTGDAAPLNLGSGVNGISTFTNCVFYKSSTNPISGTINTGKDPKVTYCGFDVAVPTTYADKTGCITGITSASFTDAANGDWSLSPTSAAIDAGTTVAAVTTDITGTTLRPLGAAYDMGAYEAISRTTGLESVKQFVCFTENHNLKLQGLSNGAQLRVYGMTGSLLINKTAVSSNVSIPLTTGFYMVTVVDNGGSSTQKVIVR